MKIRFHASLLSAIMFSAPLHPAQVRVEPKPSAEVAQERARYGCLAPNISPDAIVQTKPARSKVGVRVVQETVGQRLRKLGARCRKEKLVDRLGREIRFHYLEGCWGNPPADYLEILDNERKELRELRKKFTVIEIVCTPSGLMPF